MLEKLILVVLGGVTSPLIIWAARGGWRYLHAPYDREDVAHLPVWLQRLRWWMISEPDQRLSFTQWIARHLLCPLEGHEFPRDLPNNEGRWCIAGTRGDGDHWFGVCKKCNGMLQSYTQGGLDKLEMAGVRPYQSRRPKRLPQVA